MMDPGEQTIVGDAIYRQLTEPAKYENPVVPAGTPAQVAGKWTFAIQYSRGVGEQVVTLTQAGGELQGTQQGEIYTAPIQGVVHANQVQLRSDMPVSGNSISWTFKGKLEGDRLSGTVHLGEFGDATWTAMRV
jgi:hypothetical protein